MKRMWSKNELARQVKEVKKDITTLVDKDGHPRFIEGDINIPEIEGVTKEYGKWSLSGSHLLIVLAISIVDTTALTTRTIASFDGLPQWVIDKCIPTFSNAIDYKAFNLFASNLSSQNIGVYLRKPTTSSLDIYLANNITLTADRTGRIAFDLLIDNE